MAVAECFAKANTVIRNVANARLEETDWISVIAKELGCLGAKMKELLDGLIPHGSNLRGSPVRASGDHRVLMPPASAGFALVRQTGAGRAETMDLTLSNFPDLMQYLAGKVPKQL